jgi:hypothetical protein
LTKFFGWDGNLSLFEMNRVEVVLNLLDNKIKLIVVLILINLIVNIINGSHKLGQKGKALIGLINEAIQLFELDFIQASIQKVRHTIQILQT